uniref:Uncharacterized protein MANES_06G147000 n=2 Tax=Rhizophora mucronata TaxID=61149 RepID=A0A2P2LCP3_RHIMU
MFKSWRSEKKKIKAVFKLQFQATQVPQLKKPALVISLMPEDVGKPTFKLEKAAVKDGICSWENPIYVTVKLVKEPKAGKLNEKIYHFIVSSGSSKSGYLGEASIDFADFAEETQPLTLSLPLKFANSGAVLHVTIQKMQGGTDQRFIEDNGKQTFPPDTSMKNLLRNNHTDGNNTSSAEDRNLEDEQTEGSFKGSIGSNAHTTKKLLHRRSSTDWSVSSASDGSLCDSTRSSEDKVLRESTKPSDSSNEQLKTEINNLMRQSELSELELLSLRKQIMNENRRAQDLSIQVADLKEERDELKAECEQHKSSQSYVGRGEIVKQLLAENEDARVQLEEIRRELYREKEMKTNLQLQLQETQDSKSDLLLTVRDLDEMMETKDMEISHLSSKLDSIKGIDEHWQMGCKSNMKKEIECQATPELEELAGKQHDASELDQLKQNIADLYGEVEAYREEREQLKNYIEQQTQDYEDLKQENCDLSSSLEQMQLEKLKIQSEYSELKLQKQGLEEKLKKQTEELSESTVSINELSSQVKELEKELKKQAQGFENDLEAMTHAKIEQEHRAIQAEEALRKTRWKYASTTECLHEEFRRLSLEMAGKFDENEKLTVKAETEANELHAQNRILEDRLQKANKELVLFKDQNRLQVEELSGKLDLKMKHIEQLSAEVKDRSKQLIYAEEHANEKQKAFSKEIHMLEGRIKKLTQEKNDMAKVAEKEIKLKTEMKQMNESYEETGTLSESLDREIDELGMKSALAKKEEEITKEELPILRSLQDEKERMIEKLLSEAESLRAQHTDLQHRLSEEESQKDILQTQVLQLLGELQKEEKSTHMKNKLRYNDGQATFSGEKHLTVAQNDKKEAECSEAIVQSVRKSEERSTGESMLHSESSARKSKPVDKEFSVAMPERDFSNCHTKNEPNLTELLKEMAFLKERNRSMENELKEMQERYSEISLKFAVVEGERQQLVMTVRNLRHGKKS